MTRDSMPCQCVECVSAKEFSDAVEDRPIPPHLFYRMLVHERDRLLERVADLERHVEKYATLSRHHATITCDRCGAALRMSSTLLVREPVLSVALEIAMAESGWTVNRTTASQLTSRMIPVGERDLCPQCVAALAARPAT
jgi:hypothetical protein